MRTLILLLASAFLAFSSPRPTVGARTGVTRLSAGPTGNHTCLVKANGTVACWGNNANGQIGDSTNNNIRTTPTQVLQLTNAIAVAAGASHTCALTSAGVVKCWGSNAEGQLGAGPGISAAGIPVDVPNLSAVTGITAGAAHTCARLSNGTVQCWGRNTNRQLGVNSTAAAEFSPAPVANLADAITVSAGGAHTCALRVGGAVVCWGANNQAQLGIDGNPDQPNPVAITAPLDGNAVFTAISSGGEFTCGRRANGGVFCWGDNDFGQFGNRTISSQRSRPEQVLLRVGGVEPSLGLMVSTGFRHACAIVPGSEGLQCWGANASGQAGVGISAFQNFTSSLDTEPLEVATGNAHTCVLASRDVVKCFGDNAFGQIGNGASGAPVTSRPTILQAGSGVVRNVSAGSNHSCAARSDGSAVCWGSNDSFQVLGSGGDRLVPIVIDFGTSGLGAESISAGGAHTCARGFSNLPTCWGDNQSRQANPSSTSDFLPGQNLSSGTGTTFMASAGTLHGCEAQIAGTVSCRGSNTSLQLGTGTVVNANFTRLVGGFTDVVQVSAGSSHNCVVRGNGRVACWGSNSHGQLGDNTTSNSATPRDVGLTNAVAVSAGVNHSCALLVNGQVSCWGRNDFGQVDGTTATRRTPTLVSGIAAGEAVAVAAGLQHTCILRGTGGIRCWGRNNEGQLGNNSTADSLVPVFVRVPLFFIGSTPVQFTTLSNMTSIESGTGHVCASSATGGVACWGRDPEGQLGDGTRSNRSFAQFISLP